MASGLSLGAEIRHEAADALPLFVAAGAGLVFGIGCGGPLVVWEGAVSVGVVPVGFAGVRAGGRIPCLQRGLVVVLRGASVVVVFGDDAGYRGDEVAAPVGDGGT